MPSRHRSSLLAVLLGLACVLPACAPADAANAAAASNSPAMTRAVKKPNGAGIDVQYAVDGVPQAGRATTVTLRFDGVADPAGGSVRFSADPGLTVSDTAPVSLPAGTTSTVTVQVTPAGDGITYLNVFTTQNGVTSATSVPIRVGKAEPALRSSGELKKSPAGEPVISMPAR